MLQALLHLFFCASGNNPSPIVANITKKHPALESNVLQSGVHYADQKAIFFIDSVNGTVESKGLKTGFYGQNYRITKEKVLKTNGFQNSVAGNNQTQTAALLNAMAFSGVQNEYY